MRDVLTTFAPIFALMLIPVWIPIVTVVIGAATDRVRPTRRSSASAAVDTARARSAARRQSLSAPRDAHVYEMTVAPPTLSSGRAGRATA